MMKISNKVLTYMCENYANKHFIKAVHDGVDLLHFATREFVLGYVCVCSNAVSGFTSLIASKTQLIPNFILAMSA